MGSGPSVDEFTAKEIFESNVIQFPNDYPYFRDIRNLSGFVSSENSRSLNRAYLRAINSAISRKYQTRIRPVLAENSAIGGSINGDIYENYMDRLMCRPDMRALKFCPICAFRRKGHVVYFFATMFALETHLDCCHDGEVRWAPKEIMDIFPDDLEVACDDLLFIVKETPRFSPYKKFVEEMVKELMAERKKETILKKTVDAGQRLVRFAYDDALLLYMASKFFQCVDHATGHLILNVSAINPIASTDATISLEAALQISSDGKITYCPLCYFGNKMITVDKKYYISHLATHFEDRFYNQDYALGGLWFQQKKIISERRSKSYLFDPPTPVVPDIYTEEDLLLMTIFDLAHIGKLVNVSFEIDYFARHRDRKETCVK